MDGGDIEALRFCCCRTPFYTEEGWDVNRISLLRIMVASSMFLPKISSETLGISFLKVDNISSPRSQYVFLLTLDPVWLTL